MADMQYRRLGKSGLQVSELSFGSWVTIGTQVQQAETERMLGICRDHAVNFLDGAEAYNKGQAETLMGAAVKALDWPRDDLIISSKVFFGGVENPSPLQKGLSRKHVFEACDQALKRWQQDYLDLYFCHRADPETPIEETVAAMTDLIRQGKVLYWGTSEWSAQEITEAWAVARREHLIPPTMEQPQYSLLARRRFEREYAPLYSGDISLGTTIWSPLASGILTGKYLDGVPEGSRMSLPGYEWLKARLSNPRGQQTAEVVQKISTVAKNCGISMAELAIAWCLKNPNVSTVILGASNEEQLRKNLAAADKVDVLTDDIMAQLNEITSKTSW